MQDLITIENCDICGSKDLRVFDAPGHIMYCLRCGFKFTSPRKVLDKEIADNDVQYRQEHSKTFDRQRSLASYERRMAVFCRYAPCGRVLDVGAGFGSFLHLCKASGAYECHGTEVAAFCVDFAKQEFGLDLKAGILEEACYPSSYFDAVTMWHVLEHVPSPAAMLREIARILKPGGCLFIAVPNDSVMARPGFWKNSVKLGVNRLLGRDALKLKKMYPVYAEEGNYHLSHFTPASMKRLLACNGYEALEIGPDDAYNRVSAGAAKAERSFGFALKVHGLTGIVSFDALLAVARKV